MRQRVEALDDGLILRGTISAPSITAEALETIESSVLVLKICGVVVTQAGIAVAE